MQLLGDRDEIAEMAKFHGLTTRLDPLGARYRHREKADRNSNNRGGRRLLSARCQARMSGFFLVDDTAKVSKSTRPNIGASKAPLLSPGKQTIPSALFSRTSEINLHLINGLFDCQRSRVPVLAISAQTPSAELGAG
jgi:hypothetical protein